MTLQTIGILLLILGLTMFWLAVLRLKRHRAMTGLVSGFVSLVFLTVGALTIGLSLNFFAIDQLTHEQAVGSISLKQISERQFQATLELEDVSVVQNYRLTGDQWQLHVRFLKWKYRATLMGARSLYQLDQLNGRFEDPQSMTKLKLTAYRLPSKPGAALWRLANATKRWAPWIDTTYGSSVYLPMADGARYRISVTTSGLIARPENEAARRAVRDW
jgi:hypothetical protein